MKAFITLLSLNLLISISVFGQIPTTQDCLGAIPVCQEIYMEAFAPSNNGNYPNEINTSISCTAGEINAVWYTFTVNSSGDFGFVITPNDLNDDYDWALFNITNATCSDIFTDPSLVVSCNAAGGFSCHGNTGANGESIYSNQGGGCGNFPPQENAGFTPFNSLVSVQQGNTYVLMVSNWSQSPNGYTIDFGVSSDAGIFDNIDPELTNINAPTSCGQSAIVVDFSEFIQCSTIDDANFELLGPGGPYSLSVSGGACDAGGAFEKTFTLLVDPPIASRGTFTLQLNANGSTEVLDLCDNPAAPQTLQFDVDVPIAIDVELGADTTLVCDGDTYTIDATIPGGLSYEWEDGTVGPLLTIDQAGIYAVTIEDACGFGSDQVQIIYQMDVPQIELGMDQVLCEGEVLVLDAFSDLASYEWSEGSMGSSIAVTTADTYSVSVTNACGTTVDQITVDFIQPIVLELGEDLLLCAGESLVLDASQEQDYSVYLWQDGSSNPTFTVTTAGVYSVVVDNGCEVVSDQIEINYVPGLPNVDLGEDMVLCEGEILDLDVTNDLSTYLWQDGSTAPNFSITTPGTYSVSVENVCGVVTDEVMIDYIDLIDLDLGEDIVLCEGEILSLNASQVQDYASYLWQDGSTDSVYELDKTGTYSVTVTTDCEEVIDSIEVAYISLTEPANLGMDTLLCPGDSLMLDVTIPEGTYLWQDGSTDPIFTIREGGTYAVTVSSACDTTMDEVVVQYFLPILTELGRDTFLCPGEPIVLDATSFTESDYLWSNGETDPVLRVKEPGVYRVTVSNNCEEVIDEVEIFECEVCDVYVPNAFSPNDDGFNDEFGPLSDCILLNFNMKIFDRWGALLFESDNTENTWDGEMNGEPMGSGVFVWVMEYVVIENNRPRAVRSVGDIALLR